MLIPRGTVPRSAEYIRASHVLVVLVERLLPLPLLKDFFLRDLLSQVFQIITFSPQHLIEHVLKAGDSGHWAILGDGRQRFRPRYGVLSRDMTLAALPCLNPNRAACSITLASS